MDGEYNIFPVQLYRSYVLTILLKEQSVESHPGKSSAAISVEAEKLLWIKVSAAIVPDQEGKLLLLKLQDPQVFPPQEFLFFLKLWNRGCFIVAMQK